MPTASIPQPIRKNNRAKARERFPERLPDVITRSMPLLTANIMNIANPETGQVEMATFSPKLDVRNARLFFSAAKTSELGDVYELRS
jgi:hypothetical protein